MVRIREPLLIIFFIAFVFAIAIKGLSVIEKESRMAAGQSLRAVLLSIEEAMFQWSTNRIDDARSLASRPDIIQLSKQLLELPRTRDALINNGGIQEKIRKILSAELGVQGYLGFFIISPDFINLGSMRNTNIGIRNLIAEKRRGLLQKALDGESLIIPTLVSDVPLPTQGYKDLHSAPTMFVATPIRDFDGSIIAVFTIRLDPISDYSRLMRMGRIGKTGETYAFDKNGFMLTESRFEDQLREMGIIKIKEKSVLTVRITDPGVNLVKAGKSPLKLEERPPTLMASSAIKYGSGKNTDGYSDYRGVQVFGAWTWDTELDIGLATEMDENDALQSYYVARNVILGSLGFTSILSIIMTIYLSAGKAAAIRDLKNNQSFLESRVQERTDSLLKTNISLHEQIGERIRMEEQLKIAHTQLKESNTKLQIQATIDSLTQIPNRRAFDTHLQSEWNRCQRQSCLISLILFDIDFFKLYNDTYGHQAGDDCLQSLGSLLNSGNYMRRPSDLAARYGGEEFVIILSNDNIDYANQIAEQLRGDFEKIGIQHKTTTVSDTEVVTLSIGVASLVPSTNSSPEILIKMADEALYDAKKLGRNQVITYSSI